MVKFAQTHTIDAANNSANEMPTLVAERGALLMFVPEQPIPEANIGQVSVTAMRDGAVLGELLLAPPRLLPASDRIGADSRPDVEYSLKAWSAQLPWDWMRPGLSLRFSHLQRSGSLEEHAIEFTGPAELVLQNIRIGMLTEPLPASGNWFESQIGLAAIDYFQKIPVARLVVGQYLPVHFDKVVLASGKTYTVASEDQGGVYSGDMRGEIGKALVSIGINLANYGIVDSEGTAQVQPNYFRETVVHQSVGSYANGVVRHGLSGGNGLATLLDTSGNEFSHELGHGYGLGHYPGGGQWSSHNAGSGWGYDAFRNRMLSNLRWSYPAGDNVILNIPTEPFQGLYRYRSDPMAGGEPDGALSKLTLHTGYTMKRVQQALVATSQVDEHSPTGYSHWDASTNKLVSTVGRPRPSRFGVPVVTLVGVYDPLGQLPTTIYPAMYGNYGYTYDLASPQASDCYLSVTTGEGTETKDIRLAPARYNAGEMNKFHVNLAASSRPGTAALYCMVAGEKRKLAETVIAPASEVLPEVVSIGKQAGYLDAALRLPAIVAMLPQRFTSIALFEDQLRDVYGEILDWSDSRKGRVGSLYVYENPYTALREYFMLKKPSYGYFPVNGESNHAWRYMGKAEDSVTWRPEPLRARTTQGTTLSEKIVAYYGVATLKDWAANDTTVRRGQVYQYHNPYTKLHEYFMARSSSYWYFPTNARSNKHWIYLGNDASMNAVFFSDSAATFEAQLTAWHRQDGLRSWGVPTTRGVVGELYRYAYAGRVDYFRLKSEHYWYFPTDKTSNGYWEYLGSME